MRLRYVVYSTPKKHSHLFRPSVLKELRKVSRPLPKHVGNKAAGPMTQRNNPFCSEMSAPLKRNNKKSAGLSRTLRGSCTSDWPTAYPQNFHFQTFLFLQRKNIGAKKMGFSQHLFANFEVYKSTDTINSKHVVLMHLGLAPPIFS